MTVLHLIPPNASMLSPYTMIGYFADRDVAVLLLQSDPSQPNKEMSPRDTIYTMDYVVLDANERRFPQEMVAQDLGMSYFTNTNCQLIFDEDDVFVLRHRAGETLNP